MAKYIKICNFQIAVRPTRLEDTGEMLSIIEYKSIRMVVIYTDCRIERK